MTKMLIVWQNGDSRIDSFPNRADAIHHAPMLTQGSGIVGVILWEGED